MSHYTIAVILPADEVPGPDESPILDHDDVGLLVEARLGAFDENLVVEPYSQPLDAFHLALLVKMAREKGLLLIPEELGEQPSELRESDAWMKRVVERVGIGAILEACSAISHDEQLHLDERGEIAQRTTVNPLGRWDWFTIGGRWAGKFDPDRGRDVLRIGEIDWPELERKAREEAAADWDQLSVSAPDRLDGRSREEHIATAAATYLPTAALLTADGEWEEPARIGWFGTSYNETMSESDWARRWLEKVRSAGEDAVLVLVDCHT
jgi:hypothetical protein